MGPVRAAWGRGKVAWGGVGLSRVEYHGTDAQASLGRVGPVRAAWGRGKVAWGGVGLSRVEYHGTDAEASLTSGRRPQRGRRINVRTSSRYCTPQHKFRGQVCMILP